MTVQQLIDALNRIPEEMRNDEFVVFCQSNGVRVRFPTAHVPLTWHMSHGVPMIGLTGSQDESQLD